jgi:DnaJ-class molecular chaperone
LDGRILLVKNKAGEVIKPGDVKQIDNEGMPKHRNIFSKGHLLIKFEVEFPNTMPKEMSEALQTVLPPKPKIEKNEDFEEHILGEYMKESPQQNQREEAYMEDEEGIQCGTQ